MGLQRVGNDWVIKHSRVYYSSLFICTLVLLGLWQTFIASSQSLPLFFSKILNYRHYHYSEFFFFLENWPISTSCGYLSGILTCLFIWDKILCFFILVNFLWCGFGSSCWGIVVLFVSSVYPLVHGAKGLVKAFWWEGFVVGKLGLALVGNFNPIIHWWVGLCTLPVSCLAWGDPDLGSTGSMVGIMATSKSTYAKRPLPGLMMSVPLSPWQVTANPQFHRRPYITNK